ncbi:MAG: alpha/beta fold hydrolase [Euryarchaeota archaeon]|nr:alpha/beta fold hydrolase [Euryarchaeota archaeon]
MLALPLVPRERRTFTGPTGHLDARLEGPADGRRVLLLHPHPEAGGSMGSRLVYDLATGLADRGHRTIRFDFRGVGQSEGRYDDGIGETADATAVLEALHDEHDAPLVVVGHSFGGGVAVRLASERADDCTVILISTPLRVSGSSLSPIDDARRVMVPCHVLIGSDDPLVPVVDADRLADALPLGRGPDIIENGDHFLTPEHTPAVLEKVTKILDQA